MFAEKDGDDKTKTQYTSSALAFAAHFRNLLTKDKTEYRKSLKRMSIDPHMVLTPKPAPEPDLKPLVGFWRSEALASRSKLREEEKRRRQRRKLSESLLITHI